MSSASATNRASRLRRPALILLSLLLLVRLTHLADRLFFLPSREPFTTPRGVQDVSFVSADGLRLHGWFLPARQPDGTPVVGPAPAILHVHGNAGNIESHIAFSQFLPRRGVGVLVFDYRSFGRSEGGSTPLNRNQLMRDTEAAWAHLRSMPQVNPARLGVLGVSVGNTFAMRLAATHADCRAVVAAAPFVSWPRIAGAHAPVLGWALVRSGLDPISDAKRLGTRPLLVVHGDADTIVPLDHGRRVHAAAVAAGVDSELFVVPGAGHNDLIIEDSATQERIARFLSQHLASPGSPFTGATR